MKRLIASMIGVATLSLAALGCSGGTSDEPTTLSVVGNTTTSSILILNNQGKDYEKNLNAVTIRQEIKAFFNEYRTEFQAMSFDVDSVTNQPDDGDLDCNSKLQAFTDDQKDVIYTYSSGFFVNGHNATTFLSAYQVIVNYANEYCEKWGNN